MKTKVRMIPTLFVVAVLGAGAYIILPSLTQTLDRDDGGVTVLVEFDPPRRSGKPGPGRTIADLVIVQLLVSKSDVRPPERVLVSPWGPKVVYPNKGTKVYLHAEQSYGQSLYCMVRQHGHKPVEMKRSGATEVNCAWTVV